MNSFEKLIKSIYPVSKKLYMKTKLLNWGSVYWWSMIRWSMSSFILLLNFYIKVCMCVHGGQLLYVSFKNLLFHSWFDYFWTSVIKGMTPVLSLFCCIWKKSGILEVERVLPGFTWAHVQISALLTTV